MNDRVKIVFINVFVSFLIAAYGTFRCNSSSFRDPITGCVFKDKQLCKFVDGWGMSHFFYFMILGYCFPQELTTIFMMGVLWEAIESYSSEHPFYLTGCKYTINTDDEKGWWYGRWQDIVMNSLGMVCGYYLAQFKRKKHYKKKKMN